MSALCEPCWKCNLQFAANWFKVLLLTPSFWSKHCTQILLHFNSLHDMSRPGSPGYYREWRLKWKREPTGGKSRPAWAYWFTSGPRGVIERQVWRRISKSLRTEDGRCGEENVVGGQRGEGGMTSRTLTTYRACRIGNIVIEHLLSWGIRKGDITNLLCLRTSGLHMRAPSNEETQEKRCGNGTNDMKACHRVTHLALPIFEITTSTESADPCECKKPSFPGETTFVEIHWQTNCSNTLPVEIHVASCSSQAVHFFSCMLEVESDMRSLPIRSGFRHRHRSTVGQDEKDFDVLWGHPVCKHSEVMRTL